MAAEVPDSSGPADTPAQERPPQPDSSASTSPQPQADAGPRSDGGGGNQSQAQGQSRAQDGRQDQSRKSRRRRGRRPRRNRSRRRDNGGEGDQDTTTDVPDDPEQLEAESRPLGLLDVLGSGSGFIRRREASYTPSNDDIYVSAKIVQKFNLRTGDELMGIVGKQSRNGKSPPLAYLHRVNDREPDEVKRRPDFQRLSAVHPDEQLVMECGRTIRGEIDYTNRVIDLFCPLGKGQRAMIVAPSKAGKTTVLQAVAEGIVKNSPECHLMLLLVDERPEEVTEMESCGFGEVIASTFDRTADRHCQVAEMTLERARRRVEHGEDVVIILDSITRMARAYNTVESGSGRTMSGGLDSQSLEKPKRFLGSARKIAPNQGGGSLTIIATALVDTGSRMDQVIFEEFKGTGNSELVLSRELADRRIFPAIDIQGSATRKEELLLDDDALWLSRAMRRQLAGSGPAEAMMEVLGAMKKTKGNRDLIEWARQQQ